jgi:hypothetical protein
VLALGIRERHASKCVDDELDAMSLKDRHHGLALRVGTDPISVNPSPL